MSLSLTNLPNDILRVLATYCSKLTRTVLWWTCKCVREAIMGMKLLNKRQSCIAAARNGYLGVVQWCIKVPHGCASNTETDIATCAAAARGGHLEVLQWLRIKRYEWRSSTSLAAVEGGHLGVLRWCIANGASWSSETVIAAITYSHIEMVKLLKENGGSWNGHTYSFTARNNGNLEMLQWLRANGSDRDKDTPMYAAQYGNLEMLKWSINDGCVLRSIVCDIAHHKGYQHILEWCKENVRGRQGKCKCGHAYH